MPPRPFPFALRVGTDIVSIDRIRNAITSTRRPDHGKTALGTFLQRLFTLREQKIFHLNFPNLTLANADEQRLRTVSAHLAGRWAAKEAAIKAVKPRKCTLLDIEVLYSTQTHEMYALIRDKTWVRPKGARTLKLTQEGDKEVAGAAVAETEIAAQDAAASAFTKQTRKEEHDPAGQVAALSISHEKEYATAVCIAPFGPLPGDVGGEAAARMYDVAEVDGSDGKSDRG